MKTAISVPDETFDRVSRRADDLSMSRSEFFSRAAEHYLDELDSRTLTQRIDSAIEHTTMADGASADAVDAGRRVLAEMDGEW